MSRRGSVLENYQAPPYLDTRQGVEMQKMTDDAIARMATLTAQSAMQGQQQKGDDQWKKIKMVDDATDPTKYQAPGLKSNSAVTEQLLKIKQDAMSSKDPIDKVYLNLQQQLTPLAQGFTTYRDNLVEQDKLANEAVKANPNLDLEKVKIDMQKMVGDEFMTTNPDGSLSFNQSRFGTKSNALSDILKPENAWKYSKGSKGLYEAMQKGGDKGELFQRSTDGSQINHTTNVPFWGELIDEKTGKKLEVDPKTGLIPTGAKPKLQVIGTPLDYQETDNDGKPVFDKSGNPVMKTMKVVPQKTMDAVLFNDELKYQFEADFQRYNQMVGAKIPPEQMDEMRRIHFSKLLSENGLPQPYVSSRTNIPKQPSTRISINTGNNVPTMDIVTPVRDYFGTVRGTQKSGLEGVAQLNLFNNEVTRPIVDEVKSRYPDVTASDIYYNEDGKDIWVMKANEAGKVDLKKDTPVFKLDDFSNISGNKPQGQKSKNKALEEAQKGGGKTNKTFNVINPNTGEVIMKGVDEQAANKAKAKGYKIQ